jgi:hypothetical protein
MPTSFPRNGKTNDDETRRFAATKPCIPISIPRHNAVVGLSVLVPAANWRSGKIAKVKLKSQ